LSRKWSYKINSFILYTGVSIEEKQMYESTPFFSNLICLSWLKVQDFQGFISIFVRGGWIRPSETGESLLYIYCNMSNVQGVDCWAFDSCPTGDTL
jgi:hypothetical protein